MGLEKLFRHEGEPCWLGLRRSFWLHLLFTALMGFGLVALWWYGLWLVSSDTTDRVEALEKRLDKCPCASADREGE